MNLADVQPLTISDELVESSTDYDTHPDSETEDLGPRAIQHLRYFVFSFNNERGPQVAHLGWRFDRGTSKLPNRNVDFLLAKPGDNMSRSLTAVHMKFRFNVPIWIYDGKRRKLKSLSRVQYQ
ncbi:hypothetical protein GJ744_008602 [Endocarpon pusillum]|uniref:Uncharacterized protein n=1 Tax=Endocarpon pusillum TaxID=364733 RepID=A0A8H7AGW2_9EURO|nr:hypothetical protein GJ744_008602 [Endocarpon pusillum]